MREEIQLIKVPIDRNYLNVDNWYMPLDLILIANSIKEHDVCVDILDGTHLSTEEIIKNLNPKAKFIGLTYTCCSIVSLNKILNEAKKLGLFTVIGGQAATADAEELIKDDRVDLVVVNDGESSLHSLIEADSLSCNILRKIPNLVFSNGNGLERTKITLKDITYSDTLKRDVGRLNPTEYIESFHKSNTLKNIVADRPINIFSKRGCNKKCSFCARVDKCLRMRSPGKFLKEIINLADKYEIDYVVDTSDTWIQNDWLEEYEVEFRRKAPSKIRMMIFADARDINPQVCKKLTRIGIDNVLLGVESGSESVLSINQKKMTRKEILTAVQNLINTGIKVSCSFVLGLPTEDEVSLTETKNLALRLMEYDGVRCYFNILIPLPGSKIWKELKLAVGSDNTACASGLNYDLELARKAAIENLTSVDGGIKRLEAFRDKLLIQNDLDILEYAR